MCLVINHVMYKSDEDVMYLFTFFCNFVFRCNLSVLEQFVGVSYLIFFYLNQVLIEVTYMELQG